MRDPGDDLSERLIRLSDGRTFRAVVGGEEGPLVILEAGLGNPAATWFAVQRRLAATCRTIAYDRAGLGGSDPADTPRTIESMAADAEQFLDAAGVDEPALLAGHSWGGQLVRLIAEQATGRATGVMLVDPTVSAVIRDGQVDGVVALYARLHRQVREGGRPRLLADQRERWDAMSDAELDTAMADFLTISNLDASQREARHLAEAADLLESIESWPSPVPIRYLVGTQGATEDAERRLLISECARIAALTPGGLSVEVDDARHSIPQESPLRTAEEIARFAHECAR